MTEDTPHETKVVRVGLQIESTHDLKAVVLISYNEDEDEWSIGFKRTGEPKQTYGWLADRLRSFCTELELQGMIEGEEPEPEGEDDDGVPDSGDGVTRPDGQ